MVATVGATLAVGCAAMSAFGIGTLVLSVCTAALAAAALTFLDLGADFFSGSLHQTGEVECMSDRCNRKEVERGHHDCSCLTA